MISKSFLETGDVVGKGLKGSKKFSRVLAEFLDA
jgi:hypothetical protein